MSLSICSNSQFQRSSIRGTYNEVYGLRHSRVALLRHPSHINTSSVYLSESVVSDPTSTSVRAVVPRSSSTVDPRAATISTSKRFSYMRMNLDELAGAVTDTVGQELNDFLRTSQYLDFRFAKASAICQRPSRLSLRRGAYL